MAVQFNDIAERVCAIHHPVGFFAGIVVPYFFHYLPATMLFNQLDAAL
jgi:hypothetical protein